MFIPAAGAPAPAEGDPNPPRIVIVVPEPGVLGGREEQELGVFGVCADESLNPKLISEDEED